MVAQAQFSDTDVKVQPGETMTLPLTLINLGNRTDSFTLVPSGLLAGWVRIEPPTVTLFGGSQQQITVTLRPPQLATTPAGPAPLTVRVIPQDEPDDVGIAETTVIVGAFHDRRLHLLQPVVRSRRRAVYEFLVENQGNSQASCRLHLVDTSRRLDGDFDPPAVGIEPGANSLVRLRMKAVRRHWRRGSRTLPFSIEADQQGYPTAEAQATFVQTPAFPDRLGRRLLGLAVLAGIFVASWFVLFKPLAERTAKKAARAVTPTVIVTSTVPGQQSPPPQTTVQPTASTVAVPTPTTVDPGDPFLHRLAVSANVGASGSDQYVVPAGKVLRITDYGLQNPGQDHGTAVMALNDAPLVEWNLEVYGSNDSQAVRSPLVFQAGQAVKFTVACTSSDVAGGPCTPGLLLVGTLGNA